MNFSLEGPGAILLVSVSLLLASSSLWLAKENRELRAHVQSLTQPTVDSLLPPLSGSRLDGSQTELNFAFERRATLLLVFNKTCTVCDRVWPIWQSALKRIDSSKLRVVFIDLSRVPDPIYLMGHGISSDAVLTKPDPVMAYLTYRLGGTPETILTSPGGRVKKVWAGLLAGVGLRSFMSSLPLRGDSISGATLLRSR